MSYGFQVSVDAADPHAQADWWADALGWEVEPQDADFIRDMVSKGFATEADTIVHDGQLRWREGVAIRCEGHPRVLFQLVPESKTVKNRVHLDVQVGQDNVEAEVERLTARGASFSHRGQQGPHSWVTMTDPEGNEFCVT
ncbi:VOC family protein [Nonomuraea sp. NPDC059023]|uniref:VOC family protein n=1 Tax=unclassified Nonomuraea TaxID=2593643 RepID=UPI003690D808